MYLQIWPSWPVTEEASIRAVHDCRLCARPPISLSNRADRRNLDRRSLSRVMLPLSRRRGIHSGARWVSRLAEPDLLKVLERRLTLLPQRLDCFRSAAPAKENA